MILRLFLKQWKLFLVIAVECVHTILFSVYLFKQMCVTFTNEHKIYVQKKISSMYSPVCDFSGSPTKCWISAHTWSCGHGYRLRVLCTVGLPVPKYMSGMARVLSWLCQAAVTEPDCRSSGAVFASPGCHCLWCPWGRWAQSCLRYQVEFLCPDCCASSATEAVCLCLWGRASTDMSSAPAGSSWRVQSAAGSSEFSRACCASLVASTSHQTALQVMISVCWWCSAVNHICTVHIY